MKLFLDSAENFMDLINHLQKDDIIFCSDMTILGQNSSELKKRIDFILACGACVYFKTENIEFSPKNTQEQKELYHFLNAFYQFDRANILKRRQIGIQKAKEEGRYSKERQKKIPLDLREIMLKEKEAGVSVAEIIKKYHISRKTFYNYTQGATKNILKSIENLLNEELSENK